MDYSYYDDPECNEEPEEEDFDNMLCENCLDPAKNVCGCGMVLCDWCYAIHREMCEP